MSLINPARMRTVAAGGVLALAAGSFGALAVAPANAASGTVNYTCAVTNPLPVPDLKFTATADTDAPASMKVGQSITPTLSATVQLDQDTTNLLTGALVGAEKVSGTGTIDAVVGGAQQTRPATIAETTAPESGPMSVVATAVLAPVTASKAGNLVISVRDFTANLDLKKADGSPANIASASIECIQDPGQNATVDTVKVTAAPKAKTKTKVAKVKVNKAKRAVIKVKVNSKAKVKGKVQIVVKRGKKKVQAKNVKVNKKGIAKLKTKKLKRGKYRVNAKFKATKALRASASKRNFKVK